MLYNRVVWEKEVLAESFKLYRVVNKKEQAASTAFTRAITAEVLEVREVVKVEYWKSFQSCRKASKIFLSHRKAPSSAVLLCMPLQLNCKNVSSVGGCGWRSAALSGGSSLLPSPLPSE